MSLDSAIQHLLKAKRISAPSQSYAKDNPGEWMKVRAYLEGGARPTGVTTEMGLGLIEVEDARRGATPPPPPSPPGSTIIFQDDFETNYPATNGLNPSAASSSAPWPASPGKPACAPNNQWGTWGRNLFNGGSMANVVPPALGKNARCMKFDLPSYTADRQAAFAERGTNRVLGERYYGTMFYLPPTWREPAGGTGDVGDINSTWGCMLNEIIYWPFVANGGQCTTILHADSCTLSIASGDGVYGVDHASGSQRYTRYGNGGGYLNLEGNMGPKSQWMVIPPGQMDKEVWHEIIVGVNWQIDSTGFWKAWWRRKGEATWSKTVDVSGFPTHWWGTDNQGCTYTAEQMIGSPTYLNLGPYRAASQFSLHYWVDNYVEGTTFDVVAATMP